jgi:AcrR family transcriptional regulator
MGPVNREGADNATGLPLEGLRERKKRQMRKLISDTATTMFLERGFDEVRVTEVAAECGVSEKTVYNYFPTKESLLLDREEDSAVAIRAALGPGAPARSPIQGALEVLNSDLEDMRLDWGTHADSAMIFERFVNLIESTPSLRAAQRDMMDRLVQVAAEAMADRAGISPDDPEPQIAAAAMLGLWRIQFRALRLSMAGSRTFDEVYDEVTAAVTRAARLIDSGLWAFEVMVQGRGTREQVKAAAEAAQSAGRQVATALRQARDLWRRVQMEHHNSHGPPPPRAPGRQAQGRQVQGRQAQAQHGQRAPLQRELEERIAAQHELKRQYRDAMREQQRALRESLRTQQQAARTEQQAARRQDRRGP